MFGFGAVDSNNLHFHKNIICECIVSKRGGGGSIHHRMPWERGVECAMEGVRTVSTHKETYISSPKCDCVQKYFQTAIWINFNQIRWGGNTRVELWTRYEWCFPLCGFVLCLGGRSLFLVRCANRYLLFRIFYFLHIFNCHTFWSGLIKGPNPLDTQPEAWATPGAVVLPIHMERKRPRNMTPRRKKWGWCPGVDGGDWVLAPIVIVAAAVCWSILEKNKLS